MGGRFSKYGKDKKQYRRHGACYQVSPWSLTWDDENYYLIAFDSQAGIIKHFRVDKMERIEVTDQQRDGQSHFRQFDMATYSKKMFGMFSGEERNVKICFANHLIGVVIDRFGKDVFISQRDENYFTVTAKVVASPQFMGLAVQLWSSRDVAFSRRLTGGILQIFIRRNAPLSKAMQRIKNDIQIIYFVSMPYLYYNLSMELQTKILEKRIC